MELLLGVTGMAACVLSFFWQRNSYRMGVLQGYLIATSKKHRADFPEAVAVLKNGGVRHLHLDEGEVQR